MRYLILLTVLLACDSGQLFAPEVAPEGEPVYVWPDGVHVITGTVQRQHYQHGAVTLYLAHATDSVRVLSVQMDSTPVYWDSTITAVRQDTVRYWVTVADSAWQYLGSEYRVMYNEGWSSTR